MSKRIIESFCLCLSVRNGLLIWGYAKLVVSLFIVMTISYVSSNLFRHVPESYDHAIAFLESVTTIIPELLDVIFTLILIIFAHKRNLKMLELYYFYSITILAVYMLVVLLAACNKQRFHMLHNMIFHHAWVLELNYNTIIGFGFGNICLQLFVMLLVRSEVLKLREVKKAKLARQKSSNSFRGLRVGRIMDNRQPNV